MAGNSRGGLKAEGTPRFSPRRNRRGLLIVRLKMAFPGKRVDWFSPMCYIVVHGGVFMNQTLTIRIPDNLKRQLEKLSETEEKPISDLVRDSLKRYIAIHRFRQLRNRVLPFAEAQGILTDEDVFKLVGKSR